MVYLQQDDYHEPKAQRTQATQSDPDMRTQLRHGHLEEC